MVSKHQFQTSVTGAVVGWAVVLGVHAIIWPMASRENEPGFDTSVVFLFGLGTAWTWLLSLPLLARLKRAPSSIACAAGGAVIGVLTFALLFGLVSWQWPSTLDLTNGAVVGSTGGLVHAVLQHRTSPPVPKKTKPASVVTIIAGGVGLIAMDRIAERENGWFRLAVFVAVVVILRFVGRLLLARLRSRRGE